jgi:hypothetical protein
MSGALTMPAAMPARLCARARAARAQHPLHARARATGAAAHTWPALPVVSGTSETLSRRVGLETVSLCAPLFFDALTAPRRCVHAIRTSSRAQCAQARAHHSDMTAMSRRCGPAARGAMASSLVVCLLALAFGSAVVRAALRAGLGSAIASHVCEPFC